MFLLLPAICGPLYVPSYSDLMTTLPRIIRLIVGLSLPLCECLYVCVIFSTGIPVYFMMVAFRLVLCPLVPHRGDLEMTENYQAASL